MPRDIWKDGVKRPFEYKVFVYKGGSVYVVDSQLVIKVRDERRRKKPIFFAPDNLPVKLEKELVAGKTREGDPNKIGVRSLDMSERDGKSVVYAGVYAISLLSRVERGIGFLIASPDPAIVEKYSDPELMRPPKRIVDFLAELRRNAGLSG